MFGKGSVRHIDTEVGINIAQKVLIKKQREKINRFKKKICPIY